MKRYFAILSILTILAACTTMKATSEGYKITKEQVEEIKPGVTTKDNIIDAFGNPTNVEQKEDGTEVLTYTYKEKKTPTYLKGLIINERGSTATTATLEIVMKDGTVLSYNFKKQEKQ